MLEAHGAGPRPLLIGDACSELALPVALNAALPELTLGELLGIASRLLQNRLGLSFGPPSGALADSVSPGDEAQSAFTAAASSAVQLASAFDRLNASVTRVIGTVNNEALNPPRWSVAETGAPTSVALAQTGDVGPRAAPASHEHKNAFWDAIDNIGRFLLIKQGATGIYQFVSGKAETWLAEHVPFRGVELGRLSKSLGEKTRPVLEPLGKFLKALPKSREETDEAIDRLLKSLPKQAPRVLRGVEEAEGAAAPAAARVAERTAGKAVAGGIAKRLLGGATARIGGKLLGAALPGVDFITWPLLLDDIGDATYAEEMKNPHFRAIADLQNAFNSPAKMAAMPAWELSLALQDTEARKRKMERDDPHVTRGFRPYGALSRTVDVIIAEQDRRRKLGTHIGGAALPTANGNSPITARSDVIAARRANPPIKSVRAIPKAFGAPSNSIAHVTGLVGKTVRQRHGESSALGHANAAPSRSRGLTASVHAATAALNNLAQREAHVPTGCCCAPTQVQTTINLDGRTIATAVSKHQARSISGPRGSYLRPDPNTALHTSGSVYRF